jgi:hypothetical protein
MTMGYPAERGGVFAAEPAIVLSHFAPSVLTTGDVDGDGDADVIGLNPMIGGTETRLYRYTGGTLVDDGPCRRPAGGHRALGIAFGDLDHDGDPDFIGLDVMLSTGSGNLDVYRTTPAPSCSRRSSRPRSSAACPWPCCRSSSAAGARPSRSPTSTATARVDVATTDIDAGGARVFFGDGALGFGPRTASCPAACSRGASSSAT